MKKIAVAAATSVALLAAPVVAAGPAAADCHRSYSGCATPPNESGPKKQVVNEEQRPKVVVDIKPVGNRTPKGTVVIRIIKPNGKVIKKRVPFQAGESDVVRLPKLDGNKKGKEYTVRVTFVPKNKKRFGVSKTSFPIKVKG